MNIVRTVLRILREDIEDEGRKAALDAARLRHGDRLIVEDARMLHRIDAGHDRILDALRAMRVGGDLEAAYDRREDGIYT